MNNTIKGITIEIGGDTSKLGKALQNVEKQSKSLSAELGQINRLLKLDPGNTELLAQKQKVLAEAISSTAKKLEALKTAEAQVQAQFERGEVSEEQVRALQREIIQTEGKLSGYEKAAKETADEIERLGDASEDAAQDTDQLGRELDDVGDAAEKAGANTDIIRAAFAGLLANIGSDVFRAAISKLKEAAQAALEVGMGFESSMAEVAAISGATGDDLSRLEETAREFGATTVFSASEAADALKYMALAGWSTEQSISALPGILNLAAASGMELASASDMVTDYLSAFSMQASDAEYFADLLAYAQSNANTTAEQLGEAYKNCAANLNAAGQDVETVTALLSAMANQGLKSSEAGTALNAIMRDITSAMEDGAIAIGDTSVTVQDSEGNYRDLTEILKDVEKATDGMGDAERAAALASTFTSDSTKGLNLILNEGVDSSEEFEDSLRSCSGTASKMADTMNDTLAGDVKEMNSAFEELGITIYQDFEGSMRSAVKTITNKVIPALSKGAKWASTNGTTIKAAIAAVTTAVIGYGVAVTATSAAQGGMTAAIEASTVATKLMNAAQAASPWGLVAVGVGAVVAALSVYAVSMQEAEQHTTNLTEAEQAQVEASAEAAQAWRENKDALDETAAANVAQIDHVQALADELSGLADANGVVQESDRERAQYILGELNQALGTEYTMTGNVIDQYGELTQSVYEAIAAKRAQALLDVYNQAYTDALKGEADAWNALTLAEQDYQAQMGIVSDLRQQLAQVETECSEAHINAQNAMDEGDRTFWANRAAELENRRADLSSQWSEENALLEEKKAAYDLAASNYGDYSQTIMNYEAAESAALQGNYDTAKDLLQKKTAAYQANNSAAGGYVDQNIYAFGRETASVNEETQKQLDTLRKKAVDAGLEAETTKTNFENGVSGFTFAMVQEAQTGYQNALNAYSSAYSDAYTLGGNMGSGLNSGLSSWAQQLKNTAVSMVKNAINAAKSKKGADTHSPSKKTVEIGQNMGKGFSLGIEKTDAQVQRAAVHQMQAAMAAYEQENERGQHAMNAVARTDHAVQAVQNSAGNVALLNGINEILSAIKAGQMIVLNDKTLVGRTASAMDAALGRRRGKAVRGCG